MVPFLTPDVVVPTLDHGIALPTPGPPECIQLPILRNLFQHTLITKAPNEKTRLVSPLTTMLQISLSQSQKATARAEIGIF